MYPTQSRGAPSACGGLLTKSTHPPNPNHAHPSASRGGWVLIRLRRRKTRQVKTWCPIPALAGWEYYNFTKRIDAYGGILTISQKDRRKVYPYKCPIIRD